MNRRDIIILATVVNAVLLLVLFTTAQRPNKNVDFPVTSLPVKMMDMNNPTSSSHKIVENNTSKVEVKKVNNKMDGAASLVKEHKEPESQKVVKQNTSFHSLASDTSKNGNGKTTVETTVPDTTSVAVQPKVMPVEPVTQVVSATNSQPAAKDANDSSQYTTIVVKKGDFLERIAKANHTTVAVLMQINDLSSTQLKIGQVIKVPVSDKVETNPQVKVSNPNDYYVVKEGDSPWGIALRNGIRLNDLLQMNDLDEQKARKLRPGDRLRIR